MTELKKQCPEFPFFGASYPDARCVDGYLFDMDDCNDEGMVYVNDDHEYPCPFCNTKEFMQDKKDNEENLDEAKEWMDYILKRYA